VVAPPDIAVTPFGKILLCREIGRLDCPEAIVLRALAAEVFAVSITFRKKPLFFAFGAINPPKGSLPSAMLPAQSSPELVPGLDCEAWLEWYVTPVKGVSGRPSSIPMTLELVSLVSMTLKGLARTPPFIPNFFR
jgi:hypothetical protein